MTVAFWCVAFNGFFPLILASIAKITAGFGLSDNQRPRLFLSQQTGASQRANWAQQNSWEAFAPFAAAVCIGHIAGAELGDLNMAALVFSISRIAYAFFYITNMATARSIVWMIGLLANLYLYYLVL